MRFNIIMAFFCILFVSCAHMTGQDNKAESGFSVAQVDNPKVNAVNANGKIKVEYESYASILSKAEEKIRNELLSKKDAEILIKSIPPGGRFIVYIFRLTAETGNLRNFSYVIYKDKKEISRFEGGAKSSALNTVPNIPTNSGWDGRYWTNLETVDVLTKLSNKEELGLFVIDKAMGGRDEFTMSLKK